MSGIIINPYAFAAAETFSSTKSLNFDGVDDYVDCGNITTLNGVTEASWSGWFKLDNTTTYPFGQWGAGTDRQIYLLFLGTSNRIDVGLAGNVAFRNTTTTIPSATWFHLAITYNGANAASSRCKVYLDSVEIANSGYSGPTALYSPTSDFHLGKKSDTTSFEIDGNIDEFAIFDTELTQLAVTEIYNIGTPNNLNELTNATGPSVWYRMGENATFKSPQILMPENTNKDKVSNYSMDFDGTDDYIDCGSYSALNSGTAVTVSVWFKSSVYTNNGRLLVIGKHVEIYQGASAYSNTQGRFYYRLRGTYGVPFATFGGTLASGVGNLCDGDWHHLCIVWDNSTTTAIIYEDGDAVITDTSATAGTLNPASEDYFIGAENAAPLKPITGQIDEVAIWNTALSPTDVASVYGEGTPNDLTSLSPIFWSRNGDDATFPTIPNEINPGTNDGTMTNMVAGDIVLDTPPSP